MPLDERTLMSTDETFRNMVYEEHQVDVSPLNKLGVGLVSSFVLDYMHLVCLGVMRKLIYLWLKGPLRCRQSVKILTDFSVYGVSQGMFAQGFCKETEVSA